MKKAEDYIKNFWGAINDGIDSSGRYISGYDVALVIKQAQIDAIEETCRVCAENAEAVEGWNTGYSGSAASVDKQSILSVADKLKKEL